MAFDGTWKVEKSENYEKFMEVMGKICICLLKKKQMADAIQNACY